MTAFTDQFAADPLDPISAMFKFLWVRFDNEPELSSLIKVGNRITFVTRQNVPKENISQGDVPEVMLTFPSVRLSGLDSTNDAIAILGRWTVTSGTQQFYNQLTHPMWLIHVLMRRIEEEGPPDLGLPNLELDMLELPSDIPFGYLDPGLNKGMIGYATTFDFRANLHYNRRSAYNV